jgi:hypothetical protein
VIAPPSPPASALRRVDASAVVSSDAAATRAGLGALVRHARTPRRLPTVARAASAHHALSPTLPAPAGLRRLVGALAGRLTVVNHPPSAVLPHAARALVRGLAWTALHGADGAPSAAVPGPGDGRGARECALVRAWRARRAARGDDTAWLAGGGAAWVAVALYEEDAAVVRRTAEHGPGTGGTPGTAGFNVALPYHVVVFAGTDAAAPPWERLDDEAGRSLAPAGAEPARPWFVGRLLVPDAWATARMPRDVRAEWAALTGRAGQADRYWYPESWERFLEPGRMVGCVSAAEVARSHPGRLPGADDPPRRAADDATWAEPRAPAPYATSAPRIERGICVPPGYCLLDCLGVVDVSLARV